MYTWDFQILRGDVEFDKGLPETMHEIFLDGFGLSEGWSIDGANIALHESTLIGLLAEETQGICGYALYSVPDVPLQGTYMLWEDAICLRKSAQRKGLSTQVYELACAKLLGRKFGWIGGRTQNPVVMKRYADLGTIFPFDIGYGEGEGRLVTEYLLQYITEIRKVEEFDRSNGICRRVYREGRLGDYPQTTNETDKFEEQLHRWGFNRYAGDAIVIVSKLKQPIQS